ncbi:MAG: release factor glutamine methyltransferase [Actinomycetota bacterium]|nr:release factor glutamine methyltransferase [Actinomycetota bacterium]
MSTFESMSMPTATAAEIAAQLRAAGCVFAEDEAVLILGAVTQASDGDGTPCLEELVRRRIRGEPLEHVIGRAEFSGLSILLDPRIFVPRRRTEYLVERAVERARARAARRVGPPLVLLDLCCGSGAIGVATATALVRAGHACELHSVDIDPAAAACARRNVASVGGQVHTGDLYGPLPSALAGRIDVITANAPYVPTETIPFMPPEARLHEPRHALDGGPDGLAVLRRVILGASAWLSDGGHLLVETGRGQVPAVAELLMVHGLRPHVTTSDEFDATVVEGTAG